MQFPGYHESWNDKLSGKISTHNQFGDRLCDGKDCWTYWRLVPHEERMFCKKHYTEFIAIQAVIKRLVDIPDEKRTAWDMHCEYEAIRRWRAFLKFPRDSYLCRLEELETELKNR